MNLYSLFDKTILCRNLSLALEIELFDLNMSMKDSVAALIEQCMLDICNNS